MCIHIHFSQSISEAILSKLSVSEAPWRTSESGCFVYFLTETMCKQSFYYFYYFYY